MGKTRVLIPTLALLLAAAGPVRAAEDPIRDSVVKIFTMTQRPDFYQPWQSNAQESLSGSGVIISGSRILTNAHVVSDSTYVQVRRAGDSKKYDATVEFVAHDGELATLKVRDPAFFKGSRPIVFGELPRQRDKVAAYGFPAGGDELSITEGVISRIEVVEYTHSSRRLLALQTDAAINPGNSGGPMIKDGKLVGISFQSFSGGGVENTGYGVPVPLIQRFLKDVSDGRYDRIPEAGLLWENMENDALRAYYKMRPGQEGVLINKIVYGSAAWGRIQEGDVLLAVDGVDISNNGTYLFDQDKRLSLTHLITMHQVGDQVPFDVLRAGRRERVLVPLSHCRDIVDGPLYDVRPSYFIYAGLVFTPVTRNYAGLWNRADMPTSLRSLQEYVLPSAERQEAVALAYVLPDRVNEGYHEFRSILVDSVNGRKIKRLQDLPEAFAHPEGAFQVIRTDPLTDFGGRIVLDAAKAAEAGPRILATHRVASDRSGDLAETSVAIP
ncbi:MAG: trypsin-like peptidase domain-containing protein [Elusimicrobia bacterium]|nr:trypsin-like peptidase domain-containing protein [Elusimicrobiota bacterium]